MPELPDVESFRRYVDPGCLGRPIAHTHVRDERALHDVSPRKLAASLTHARLESTHRHGKFLFLISDAGRSLVLHFGMTGFPQELAPDEEVPPHCRLLLDFADRGRLAYVCQRLLGEVSLTDDPSRFLEARGVGPDALTITPEQFSAALTGRSGAVKYALMNQGKVAGIGNIYADEILFQAGVHPRTALHALSDSVVDELPRAPHRVLRTSIDRDSDVTRLARSYLIPHREEDAPCPRCGAPIERIKISGRGTYFCPSCQPERAR